MTTVLFIWQPSHTLKEYVKQEIQSENISVTLLFPENEKEYIQLAPQADIIVGWRPTKELLDAAENLSVIINPGAGVQHLSDLFKEMQERSITLVNGHGNAYFTAQHAVALLLAVTNKVIPHHRWMVKGEWRKRDEDAKSIPLRQKTVGLLGYGHVNRYVHTFLSGFDLSFAAVRRKWTQFDSFWLSDTPPPSLKKYTSNELDSFLEIVDILFVSVPLTSQTKGLISRKELALLGAHGFVVNVARGPVIDQKDLYTALKNNEIAGAGLDVWYDYTPDPDESGKKYPYKYPFHTLDNVVLSPHRGASPFDDLKRWDEVIENIKRVAIGEHCINVVDLEQEY